MIKIISAKPLDGYKIELLFSTQESAIFDFSYLLEKQTPLTKYLQDLSYFRSFYLELGSIGWKNGLEINGDALYQKCSGKLTKIQEVA